MPLPYLLIALQETPAAVEIRIDASLGLTPISPLIYGRNNNISDNPAAPTSASEISLYKDAGLRMSRDCGGNNSSTYNWRRKLASHPDWYNNVYAHDWDFLYLMDWPPDSVVALFDTWFKPINGGGRGLDSSRFRYWNMDNEPEIWDKPPLTAI